MDSIVKRLSEIETSAAAIVANAESQKAVLDDEMSKERDDFDKELSQDTATKLKHIHNTLASQMHLALKQQQEASDQMILSYQQAFAKKEETYAKEIFLRMTEV